ncbi:Crp/Fnr family transcriptional regulator [Geosporobacter ferrireducens]|uniref:Cyclic nucleotide-binding protein n=1 Tax=Geosporobacter ferrireducens TaxID=1424294 RepID=A0A1D8GFW7_9FIRM|nr:Crp/Fnr family transcriptional regulator [Geosporobacter ferrireducens]AOT69765.1 cyclic nucleotide-binding protein [Geosporobacter ferrireducens]MTI54523.1 Crp/Fnr family transcriptional regulator [Geosporobacter ferrireducens]
MEIERIIEANQVVSNILRDCPYEILKKWEVKKFDRGQIVCRQDEYHDYFYIITQGIANIYRAAESGKKYSQSVYKTGDYFGELEIFDKKPYICTVEALTDLKVLRIHRDVFLQWIDKDRNFLLYITRTLCDSFYKLSKKAGEDTLYPLKYKVCNYMRYCLKNGVRRENGVEIQLQKEQLSEQFVVTQRSINRILKLLKEADIIEVTQGTIIVKDEERLRDVEQESMNE